jgi:hypothetical protein
MHSATHHPIEVQDQLAGIPDATQLASRLSIFFVGSGAGNIFTGSEGGNGGTDTPMSGHLAANRISLDTALCRGDDDADFKWSGASGGVAREANRRTALYNDESASDESIGK